MRTRDFDIAPPNGIRIRHTVTFVISSG